MSLRSLLYQIAKLLGDVNAVKKGKVGRRLGRRGTRRGLGTFTPCGESSPCRTCDGRAYMELLVRSLGVPS